MPTSNLTSTTRDVLLPKLVDTVVQHSTLFGGWAARAKKWRGKKLIQPFIFDLGDVGGSYSGLDALDMEDTDNLRNMEFTAKKVYSPIVLATDELSINESSSDEEVIQLATAKIEIAATRLYDAILGPMVYADGTGNGGKDITGLKAMVDDGTSASTYGGQSRSTYTGLQSDVTSYGGTLDLDKMRTSYNAASHGVFQPDLIQTTKAVYGYYESLRQPNERIIRVEGASDGKLSALAATGYKRLEYNGAPLVADERCPTGVMWFLRKDQFDFYALKLKFKEQVKYKSQIEDEILSDVIGVGFQWTGWMQGQNQDGVFSRIHLAGELVNKNPRMSAKATNVNGVV